MSKLLEPDITRNNKSLTLVLRHRHVMSNTLLLNIVLYAEMNHCYYCMNYSNMDRFIGYF